MTTFSFRQMTTFCQNNGSKLWGGCFKETHERPGICLFKVYGAFNLFFLWYIHFYEFVRTLRTFCEKMWDGLIVRQEPHSAWFYYKNTKKHTCWVVFVCSTSGPRQVLTESKRNRCRVTWTKWKLVRLYLYFPQNCFFFWKYPSFQSW